MAEILIVEDEPSINELIRRNLQLVGHRCTQSYDGKDALNLLQVRQFDLLVLDIMLPGADGYQVYGCAAGTPVIFLTAKSELNDKLKGLTMGADDYITKPFEMLELLARIENVLRRTHKNGDFFELDQVKIEFSSRRVTLLGQAVECTPKEFDLLETLVRNRNIALSRDRLLELVWGYDFTGDTRTVDVHIQRLRKKLNWESRIATVYKLGYRLEAPL